MYLSRFEINPARRGAQKLLGSPQAMHAAVLAGFPPSSTTVPGGRVLWRVDSGPQTQTLYIASQAEPDLTHLVEQAGWPTTQAWTTRPYDGLLASLEPGQSWAFRLTANPTRSIQIGERRRSQRVGHVTAAQQLAWFTERCRGWGFDATEGGAPTVAVTRRLTRQFRRQGQTVTLVTAQFDGVLTVSDAELLREALCQGVGPAKAYGCGLLTLAPLRISQ